MQLSATANANNQPTHLYDDDPLLYYVIDLGLDELEEHVDAFLGGALDADGTAANSPYSLGVDQVWIWRRSF